MTEYKVVAGKSTPKQIEKLLKERSGETWWPAKLTREMDKGGSAIQRGLNWLEKTGRIERKSRGQVKEIKLKREVE